jgi:hypothetical protein
MWQGRKPREKSGCGRAASSFHKLFALRITPGTRIELSSISRRERGHLWLASALVVQSPNSRMARGASLFGGL